MWRILSPLSQMTRARLVWRISRNWLAVNTPSFSYHSLHKITITTNLLLTQLMQEQQVSSSNKLYTPVTITNSPELFHHDTHECWPHLGTFYHIFQYTSHKQVHIVCNTHLIYMQMKLRKMQHNNYHAAALDLPGCLYTVSSLRLAWALCISLLMSSKVSA